MTGVCSIKVRLHYESETCQKNNKCTTEICVNNKCKGFNNGHVCQPGLGQCKKGKVCSKTLTYSTIPICTDPFKKGENMKTYLIKNQNMMIILMTILKFLI